jgi:hypothetical protein
MNSYPYLILGKHFKMQFDTFAKMACQIIGLSSEQKVHLYAIMGLCEKFIPPHLDWQVAYFARINCYVIEAPIDWENCVDWDWDTDYELLRAGLQILGVAVHYSKTNFRIESIVSICVACATNLQEGIHVNINELAVQD